MNTLVIMAKQPVPGMVKTRLAASLGEQAAAGLAEAFLEDLVVRLDGSADRQVLATWPDNDAAATYFETLSAGRFQLWTQPEGSLGTRLARVISDHLAPGSDDRVVVIGSDSPTLPTEMIPAAFEALERADVVVAPADDGGYVLIGQRREVPGLYERISWSTSQVWQQTRDQLMASGTSFVELTGWYDVDTLDDLSRLDRELGSGDRQGRAGQLTRQRLNCLPSGWDTRPTDG
jgi:rSAM/selenodomain-associated transferase 1